MYELPSNYVARPRPEPWNDFDDTTDAEVWQPDVIPFAARLVSERPAKLIDVGCGNGQKLRPLIGDGWIVVGIDRPEIVDRLKKTPFPGPGDAYFVSHDLEEPGPLPVEVEGAVVVASDVIEHLIDPVPLVDSLVDALRRGAHAVVLSTPDRVRTWGPSHFGPPPNPAHCREWSLDELVVWLTSRGLEPAGADWTRSSNLQQTRDTCLILAK